MFSVIIDIFVLFKSFLAIPSEQINADSKAKTRVRAKKYLSRAKDPAGAVAVVSETTIPSDGRRLNIGVIRPAAALLQYKSPSIAQGLHENLPKLGKYNNQLNQQQKIIT